MLRTALIVTLNFAITYAFGQTSQDLCNCLKTPMDCLPEVSKRKIVSYDTMIAHHSYCYKIWANDERGKTIVLTYLCDKKPTDSFLLNFFDSTTLGTESQTWYDTSGRVIYFVKSQNIVIKECFWYYYQPHSKNYDYIIGYREGASFKELYTWYDHGATWKKKIIITAKEITTITATEHKVSIIPNKTGKID